MGEPTERKPRTPTPERKALIEKLQAMGVDELETHVHAAQTELFDAQKALEDATKVEEYKKNGVPVALHKELKERITLAEDMVVLTNIIWDENQKLIEAQKIKIDNSQYSHSPITGEVTHNGEVRTSWPGSKGEMGPFVSAKRISKYGEYTEVPEVRAVITEKAGEARSRLTMEPTLEDHADAELKSADDWQEEVKKQNEAEQRGIFKR